MVFGVSFCCCLVVQFCLHRGIHVHLLCFLLGYLRQLVLCPVMLVLLLELLNPCLFLANGRVAVNGHLQYSFHLEQLHVSEHKTFIARVKRLIILSMFIWYPDSTPTLIRSKAISSGLFISPPNPPSYTLFQTRTI